MKFPRVRLPALPRITVNPDVALLVIFLAGLFALCIGLYMVYPPLAPIAAGLILMGITLLGDRKTT